jgi:serine protease
MRRFAITLLALAGSAFASSPLRSPIPWYVHAVNAPAVWGAKQNRVVRVAIVDDGFLLTHEALRGHIWTNSKEIPNNGIDDDKNGFIDDCHGWDASDCDNDASAPAGRAKEFYHGTAIASAILSVAGAYCDTANCRIEIIPVKVLSNHASTTLLVDGYRGISYAMTLKPDIICCAWSDGVFRPNEKQITDAAISQGILVVAAAGNFPDKNPYYPASYPGVLSVAAVDSCGHKLTKSAFGSTVDIATPGKDVACASPASDSSYTVLDGTSLAAAIASGAAALFLSCNPRCTPQDAPRFLENSATPLDSIDPSYAGKLGAGRLNIGAASRCYREFCKNGAPDTLCRTSRGYLTPPHKTGVYYWTIAPSGSYRSIDISVAGAALRSMKGSVTFTLPTGNAPPVTYSLRDLPDSVSLPGSTARVEVNVKRFGDARTPGLRYRAVAIDSSTLYCRDIDTLTADSGAFDDGSGPQDYAGLQSCKWLITVKKG